MIPNTSSQLAQCESLENRRLLSAAPADAIIPVITDNNQIVSVRGTSGNDFVTLSVANGKLKIVVDSGFKQNYPLNQVSGISINLLGGDDILDINSGVSAVTASGGPGNDTITALNQGRDFLSGGAGRDSLQGGGAKESLDGGLGGDTIVAGTGADAITGDGGGDSLVAGIGRAVLDGGDGNDTIVARFSDNAGASTLKGNAGNDVLFGTGGHESLVGGSGDDTISGGTIGSGLDTLAGGAGNDSITHGPQDTVIGADSGDSVVASPG